MNAGATWIVQTNDLGAMTGPVASGGGAPLPLDTDVMWIGFQGLPNNDVYYLAYSIPPYLSEIAITNGSTPVNEAMASFKRHGTPQ